MSVGKTSNNFRLISIAALSSSLALNSGECLSGPLRTCYASDPSLSSFDELAGLVHLTITWMAHVLLFDSVALVLWITTLGYILLVTLFMWELFPAIKISTCFGLFFVTWILQTLMSKALPHLRQFGQWNLHPFPLHTGYYGSQRYTDS